MKMLLQNLYMAMKEVNMRGGYISRKDAIYYARWEGAYKVVMLLEQMPKADVKPVKRGRWTDHHCTHIEQLDANFIQAKCTCCGRYSDKIDSFCRYLDLEFCSHCGADMRKED